jgi:hypothetical protein
MLDEWPEANNQFFTWRQVFFQSHPRARPNLQTVRAYLLKENFQQFWEYNSPTWAGMFLEFWCQQTMRSRIAPMKKIARTLRTHRELLLNYFKARKQISSGVVEGLNNKAQVTMRRSYGVRTFRILELALYHSLGKLPVRSLPMNFSDAPYFEQLRRSVTQSRIDEFARRMRRGWRIM